MYDELLENDGKILFRIYRQLLTDRQTTFEDLSEKIGVCTKYVKRAIHDWKNTGNHLAFGLDFIPHQQYLTMFITNQFSERNLFAYLLSISSRFDILYTLLKDPIVSMATMEKRLYIGRKAIRHRMQDLKGLLQHYGLELGNNHPRLIKGRESQQRLLLFHLEVLKNPKLITSSGENKLKVITKISNDRKNLGFRLNAEDLDGANRELMDRYIGYRMDEPGYLFTWRQLLGVEQFWFQPAFQRFVEEVLEEDELLRDHGEELHQQIYRIHSYAALFQGDLLIQLTPHRLFNYEAKEIHLLCSENLAGYDQLLAAHPELPYAYQKMLGKKVFFDRYRNRLFEDPYLVKVQPIGARG